MDEGIAYTAVYVNKKSPYSTVINCSIVSFPHYSSSTVVLTVIGVLHHSSETVITILY